MLAAGLAATIVSAGPAQRLSNLHGTIWAANRGMDTIRGFDASSGDVVATVSMAPGSQPGDLAFAKGKLYVAEEMGASPAIAIVDARTAEVLSRIPMPGGSRPHHVHASSGGNLVSVGLYGTDRVAVVDTATDELLGEWDTNPTSSRTANRAHAGVFSTDGSTLYVASDSDRRVLSRSIRELAPFVGVWASRPRRARRPRRPEPLRQPTDGQPSGGDRPRSTSWTDVLQLTLPDTLRLSANRKTAHVLFLRRPLQVAVVDTRDPRGRSRADRSRRGPDDRCLPRPVDVARRPVHGRQLRRWLAAWLCRHRPPCRQHRGGCDRVSDPATRRRVHPGRPRMPSHRSSDSSFVGQR